MIDEVKVFKALSCDQRLAIFKKLYEWQMAADAGCGELADFDAGLDKCFTRACCCMNLTKSTVSHHFKVLEEAGLIVCVKTGQSSQCRVNAEAVDQIRNFLK